MLLAFAEKNPGMTRVLIGDALVTEDDRLQDRINQLIDRNRGLAEAGVPDRRRARGGCPGRPTPQCAPASCSPTSSALAALRQERLPALAAEMVRPAGPVAHRLTPWKSSTSPSPRRLLYFAADRLLDAMERRAVGASSSAR